MLVTYLFFIFDKKEQLKLLKQFCDDINSAAIPMKDIGHIGKKSGLEELPKSYRVD